MKQLVPFLIITGVFLLEGASLTGLDVGCLSTPETPCAMFFKNQTGLDSSCFEIVWWNPSGKTTLPNASTTAVNAQSECFSIYCEKRCCTGADETSAIPWIKSQNGKTYTLVRDMFSVQTKEGKTIQVPKIFVDGIQEEDAQACFQAPVKIAKGSVFPYTDHYSQFFKRLK